MDFIAIDFETANADLGSICQLGAVSFQDGKAVNTWQTLINPEDYFDPFNVSIHGIDEDMVKDAPTFSKIFDSLRCLIEKQLVACHTHFDRVALSSVIEKYQLPQIECTWLDTARVVRRAWERFSQAGYGLKNVANELGIEFNHHVAGEDARAAGEILLRTITETGISLQDWLVRLDKGIHPQEAIKREGNPEGPLAGEVMVFTGALSMHRHQAADYAAALGCEVAPIVNKTTTILVVGDQDIQRLAGHEKSSKHRKVEDLINKGQPIRIMGESDFLRLVNINIEPTSAPKKSISKERSVFDPFSEDNLVALRQPHRGVFRASGGIATELDLMNLPFSDDLDNFTTQLEEINEDLISQCKVGDTLNLFTERNYVGVADKSGKHLGSINPSVARNYYLGFDIDYGAEVSAKIKHISTKNGKLECIIEISKGDPDWEKYDKLLAKDNEAKEIIFQAKTLEKSNIEEAISLYRKAIGMLKEIDQNFGNNLRYQRFPINRLSLVLEKQKRYKECLEEIEAYEKLADKIGLYSGEKEKLEKRKVKIMKIINSCQQGDSADF